MKSFLFGLLAIVLAVSVSAFTQSKPTNTTKFEDPLYWYYIQTNGNIGLPVDGSNLRTKSEVFSAVGCPDETGDDCARGYSSTQTFNTPAPAVDEPDEHIMKDEQ